MLERAAHRDGEILWMKAGVVETGSERRHQPDPDRDDKERQGGTNVGPTDARSLPPGEEQEHDRKRRESDLAEHGDNEPSQGAPVSGVPARSVEIDPCDGGEQQREKRK